MYSKKSKLTVARVHGTFVFFAVLLFAVSAVFGQVESKLAKELLDQAYFTSGAPGISAAVALNGAIVFSEGVGYANLEHKVPATGSTVYRIASISKPIAAIGIMQLIEQGLVTLDDPIRKYVPSFPEKPKGTIKLSHILTHTSGIRHYRRGESGKMEHFPTFEDAITVFKDDSLLFEPGTNYNYTTYGFNLVIGIIEAVGSQMRRGRTPADTLQKIDFGEYMDRYVWEPAGMHNTFLEYPPEIVRNRANGYTRDREGQVLNVWYDDVSVKYAGGGVISTVNDLVRIFIALDNGILIKPETVQNMYKIHYQQRPSSGRGLGWAVSTDEKGRLRVNHSGSSNGFRSMLINYPEKKLTISAMSNCNWYSPGTLAQQIADVYLAAIDAKEK